MKSVLFPNSFFSILIFLYSALMVKFYFINQNTQFLDTVLSLPNSVFHYFPDSILMVPLNLNSQKHLQLMFFLFVCFFEILHIYIFLLNKFW